MSGPIVRTGTNPKFWNNWDKAFGKETTDADKKTASSETTAAKAAPKKAAKKKAGKKK